MDRAHADAGGDGQEDRGEDQDGGGQVQEAAHDEQEHVHDEQDDVAVVGDAHQALADGGGDARVGHDVGHDGRSRDQEEDGGRALHGVGQHIVEGLEGDLAVEHGQQQAVQAHDHTGLGGGEEAAQNAAHDDDDGQQGRDSVDPDLDSGVLVLDGGGLIALLDGQVDGQSTHAQAQQDAGQVAAHEQGRHRDAAGGDGVKDQRAGRGDQDAGGGRADVDGGGEVGVVAFLCLQGAQDGAHGRGGGHRRAGDRAEEHIGQHVGGGQVAGDLAHQQAGQTDQAAGNAALIHDVAAQGEERQGQQREGVQAREAALGRDQGKDVGGHAEQGGDHRGDADAGRNGDARQQQDEEGAEKAQGSLYDHQLLPPFFSENSWAYLRMRASTMNTPEMGRMEYRMLNGMCMTEEMFSAFMARVAPP